MGTRQSQFRAALLDPAAPVPDGLTDGAGAPTVKRFDVYRNNVTVALIDALRTAFPVLRKLLGDANFDPLARVYARAHPPRSPLMMHYGQDMPAFLDGFAPLKHLGYLPDVARLELALRRSYHAADSAALDAQVLAACPPETLMGSCLQLAPAVQLIPSPWPLFDIWRYNTVAGAPKPQATAQSVLITRAGFDPEPHALTAAQYAWLHACQTGANLTEAQDSASATDPAFDLAPLLGLLLQHGALTTLTTPKD
ncbi:DNA-binding domain-containing protein [uncultured Tateyamaria sp.]|uniref:HvfC/BufC N-terminal domain-containing protein n=1 Tax=Tateyamaria sp. 1078 TaxID=3417464 RepID=UPI002604BE9F|nr:DNA-binding domain-containing protein [uncultured Tateyamaria sp.]